MAPSSGDMVQTEHRGLNTCERLDYFIYAFSRRFYPKQLTTAFRLNIFSSMCVPWESNPQPFALLMQCSTTEPHRNTLIKETIVHACLYNVYTVKSSNTYTGTSKKKNEYGEKVHSSCNLVQKVELSYILDSLNVK